MRLIKVFIFFTAQSFCMAAVRTTGPFVLNSFSLAGKAGAG